MFTYETIDYRKVQRRVFENILTTSLSSYARTHKWNWFLLVKEQDVLFVVVA